MAAGPDGRWEIGIGDPTPLGWITVAAYVTAAFLAWRNVGAARRTAVPHSFWVALTALMLALGLNKQLDLQTWLSQTGRDMAIAQGWWEERRAVQALFIALLAAGAVGVVVWASRQWQTLWHEYRAAFVGVCVLLFFIVVRAASFHHIDVVLRTELGATPVHRALEVLGVLIVAGGCAWWHFEHRLRVRRFAMEQALRGRVAPRRGTS
jgi:hypothetical protein